MLLAMTVALIIICYGIGGLLRRCAPRNDDGPYHVLFNPIAEYPIMQRHCEESRKRDDEAILNSNPQLSLNHPIPD